MSARDAQTRELPIGMGPCKAKDWDGSNVLGPCIVTADEIDPHDVDLEVRINGERWGGDNTKAMHHTFESMIAYASQGLTLRAGEVLGSGTATGGSGLELDRWLEPGDEIEMEASGIGVLRNRVGPEAGLTQHHHIAPRTTNQGEEHGIRCSSDLEGQGRRGEARRGDHPQDDPALSRRGGQPLLPGAGVPDGSRARSSSTSSTSTRPATRRTRPRRTSRRTCSATSSSTSRSAR